MDDFLHVGQVWVWILNTSQCTDSCAPPLTRGFNSHFTMNHQQFTDGDDVTHFPQVSITPHCFGFFFLVHHLSSVVWFIGRFTMPQKRQAAKNMCQGLIEQNCPFSFSKVHFFFANSS